LISWFFFAAEKAHWSARDPIKSLKKYLIENILAREAELKTMEKRIDEVVEDTVEFDMSTLFHPTAS
jgi:pyruvate dehydrogenase E1 component alpha subunit